MPPHASSSLRAPTASAPPAPAPRPRSNLLRWAFPILLVAAVTALKLVVGGWLTEDTDSAYIVAVGVAAWYGGLGPGVFATALAAVAQKLFLVEPIGSLAFAQRWDALQLLAWILEALFVCFLWRALHRSRATLERKVVARTAELTQLNGELRSEVIDRVRAEEKLREATEAHRLLFEENPVPMWVLDSETLGLLAANSALLRHYGYSADELPALNLFDFRVTQDQTALRQLVREAPTWSGAAQHRKKDGSVIDVEINARRLVFAGRTALIAVIQDVTDRTRLEGELRQAQKMDAMGRIAGGVAHDFNNLLTVIMSYASMLRESPPGKEELERDLDEILSAGTRASDLTKQLLAFSRKQLLEAKVVDLNALVSNMDRMLRRLIGEDIDLTTVLALDLGCVKVDPGQIEQVVMNLAVNARDATASGGEIRIRTASVELGRAEGATLGLPAGSYAEITVTDNGTGMDESTRARIFEPFFTTKGPGKGTGLGLSTVFGIVRQSNGSVVVTSRVGEGSSFRVLLPRVDERPRSQLGSGRRAPRAKAGEVILLVEDDDMVRGAARDMLQKGGYVVLVASGAQAAMAISDRHEGRIDVLLTDVVMPVMNGPELARLLLTKRPTMGVVYMSGYVGDALDRHGIAGPDTAFLPKPFTPTLLGKKLREALDARDTPSNRRLLSLR